MVNIRLAAVCLAAASALMIGETTSMPTSKEFSKRSSSASSSSSSITHHTISRRRTQIGPFNNEEELLQWTEQHRAGLRAKYSSKLKDSNQKEEEIRKRKKRSSATTGGTQLTNYQHDSTFFAPVTVGTPGQTIGLVLDTGSSDMWTVQGKENWDPSKSSTFQNSTTPFKIAYGSGDVSGTEASDIVSLAGNSVRQEFAIATSVSQGLLGDAVEGIMGLGFPSLSTSRSTPFWQNVGASEFSFYLAAQASSSSSSGSNGDQSGSFDAKGTQYISDEVYGGIFTLGGRNSSLFQGDINWSDVIDESYWLITLGGISVNGVDVNLAGTNKVAVDTGTTLIGTPESVVNEIYAQIPNSNQMSSGYYTFPCTETDFNATVHFGDQEYTLTSTNLIAGTTDSTGTTCLGAFFSIGSTSNDELQYIFGDTFLMNVYSIFSNSNSQAQVGFASLANGLGATTSSRSASPVVAANGSLRTLSTSSSFSTIFLSLSIVSFYIFFT